VDIGLQVRVAASNAKHSARTAGGEPKELPNLPAVDERVLPSVLPPRPARFAALLEHSLSHQRVRVMRQLYKDAKTWRRHREIGDFLSQLALNVAYRDAPDRSTVLRWIERMREELEASDPVHECIERVIASDDSTNSTIAGLQSATARCGSRG
jgi:hypothetical protein